MRSTRSSSVLALAAVLAGCAGPQVVPFDPVPPRPALMQAPPVVPPINKGDDLYDDNTKLRAALGRSHVQTRGLQGYIRTLLKNRKGTP